MTDEERRAREEKDRIYKAQRDAALASIRGGRVARSFVEAGANDGLPALHLDYSGDDSDSYELKLYDRAGALVNADDYKDASESKLNAVCQKEKSVIGLLSKFACAQTAALCAAYASYPFDTVRRRLQMQSDKPKEQWLYKGTGDCFVKVAKEEGMTAFFKGAGANALRTVGSAPVLVLYGEIQQML